MSLLNLNFESQYLHGNTEVTVVLPNKSFRDSPAAFYRSGRRYPVLWLLHGTFGDHTDWLRKSNIELYAAERGVIVVMPSALNSSYDNWPGAMDGYLMWDYLLEELMPIVYGWLPASDKREDNFVAGLSMGGRGTTKLAAFAPERFAAAAILSAAPHDLRRELAAVKQSTVDRINRYAHGQFAEYAASEWAKSDPDMPALLESGKQGRILGQRLFNSINAVGTVEEYLAGPENTWEQLDKMNGTGRLPRLLFACGTADGVYPYFCAYRDHAADIGLPAEFWELEGYAHEWRFWDLAIQHALDFFGLKRAVPGKF